MRFRRQSVRACKFNPILTITRQLLSVSCSPLSADIRKPQSASIGLIPVDVMGAYSASSVKKSWKGRQLPFCDKFCCKFIIEKMKILKISLLTSLLKYMVLLAQNFVIFLEENLPASQKLKAESISSVTLLFYHDVSMETGGSHSPWHTTCAYVS